MSHGFAGLLCSMSITTFVHEHTAKTENVCLGHFGTGGVNFITCEIATVAAGSWFTDLQVTDLVTSSVPVYLFCPLLLCILEVCPENNTYVLCRYVYKITNNNLSIFVAYAYSIHRWIRGIIMQHRYFWLHDIPYERARTVHFPATYSSSFIFPLRAAAVLLSCSYFQSVIVDTFLPKCKHTFTLASQGEANFKIWT